MSILSRLLSCRFAISNIVFLVHMRGAVQFLLHRFSVCMMGAAARL